MNAPDLWNIEAERAVLGSCLIDPTATGQVASLLPDPDMFYRESHRFVYAALLRLASSDTPPEALTVADELTRMGKLGAAGGIAGISGLMDATPTAIHAEYYARIVERCAVLRQVVGAAERIAKLARTSDKEADEVLVAAQAEIFALSHSRTTHHAPISVAELSPAMLERYTGIMSGEHRPGVATGLWDLDKLLVGGGFQPSQLTIIAARPSMGKSSLMLQMALTQAKAGKRVLIFSLEMDRTTLYDRLISTLTGINLYRLQSGPLYEHDHDLIKRAVSELSQSAAADSVTIQRGMGEIVIADAPGLSPFQMQGQLVRQSQKRGPVDVVYIDHFQEVGEEGLGRTGYGKADVAAAQVRAIRNLAKLYEIPVVLLTQLNRQCEMRQDKRPVLSDLKDTGALEESADVVIFIYRDEFYHPDTDARAVAELILSKQRNGPRGAVSVRFVMETGKWSDLDTFYKDDDERLQDEAWRHNGHQTAAADLDDLMF